MIAIDTNVVVRYLTGDHPEQSVRAKALIDGQAVYVPVSVRLESEWVLRSAYAQPKADVLVALRAFGGLPTVTIEDADAVATAIARALDGMDSAEALHLSPASHCAGFASFDGRLLRAAEAAGDRTVRAP